MKSSTRPQGYIGYVEVIGFNDYKSKDYEFLLKERSNIFHGGCNESLGYEGKTAVVDAEGEVITLNRIRRARINFPMLLESGYLWTFDDSIRSFVEILAVMNKVLGYGIVCGLPVRGTIVLGERDISSTPGNDGYYTQFTVMGKGFEVARELTKKQLWNGGFVTPECIERYGEKLAEHKDVENLATLDFLQKSRFIIKYQVPFEDSSVQEYYAINWLRSYLGEPEKKTEKVKEAFSKLSHKSGIKPFVKHTLDFVKYAQNSPKE